MDGSVFLGAKFTKWQISEAFLTCLCWIKGLGCVQFAKFQTTWSKASCHINGSIRGDRRGVNPICSHIASFCFQFHGCCWPAGSHPPPSPYFVQSSKLCSSSLRLFIRVWSCLSPTSHPFILPPPYILLLWFTIFVLCNKHKRLPPSFNKVESFVLCNKHKRLPPFFNKVESFVLCNKHKRLPPFFNKVESYVSYGLGM